MAGALKKIGGFFNNNGGNDDEKKDDGAAKDMKEQLFLNKLTKTMLTRFVKYAASVNFNIGGDYSCDRLSHSGFILNNDEYGGKGEKERWSEHEFKKWCNKPMKDKDDKTDEKSMLWLQSQLQGAGGQRQQKITDYIENYFPTYAQQDTEIKYSGRRDFANEYDIDGEYGYFSESSRTVPHRFDEYHHGHTYGSYHHPQQYLYGDTTSYDYHYLFAGLLPVLLITFCLFAVYCCICLALGGTVIWKMSNKSGKNESLRYKQVPQQRYRSDRDIEEV